MTTDLLSVYIFPPELQFRGILYICIYFNIRFPSPSQKIPKSMYIFSSSDKIYSVQVRNDKLKES